jgi:alkaline phosphatase
MMTRLAFFILLLSAITASAQKYTPANIFSHNDYVQPNPFHRAYGHGAGYIEADIFLQENDLLVAHASEEIKKENTLDKLYLAPLQEKIIQNKGSVYSDKKKTLMLMIDLKTEGVPTVSVLIEKLKNYPELLSCKTLNITLSGNMPDTALWKNYPDFIYFDGRPGIAYTKDQLNRIVMISTSFRSYSKWEGSSKLPKEDEDKLKALIEDAHAKGKKMRFWASPDFEDAWKVFTDMKMDMLVTDNVPLLSAFIGKQK